MRLLVNPPTVTLGKMTKISLSIHGGKGPFTITSPVECLNLGTDSDTFHDHPRSTYREARLHRGEASSAALLGPGPVRPDQLSSHGPLAHGTHRALREGSASQGQRRRKARHPLLRCRRPPGRFTRRWPRSRKPRSTAASRPTSSRKGSTPSSSSSTVGMDKANTVKSFLDPQLRTAADHDFTGTYTLTFSTPLSTAPGQDRRLHQEPDPIR